MTTSSLVATMRLLMAALALPLDLAVASAATTPTATAAYVDPVSLNTTQCLESIRRLPLTTYRLDHDPDRLRIGLQSVDVAAVLPEAVDILPTQIIPPLAKNSSGGPIIRRDVPIVNEQVVFLTGVGATQELIAMVSSLDALLQNQIDRLANLASQVGLLEELMTSPSTTDGEEELRMRAAAAEAAIAKAEMELEVARAKDEEEYIRATIEAELVQVQRSEELTLQRLAKEDEAARVRAEEAMRLKLEAAQKVEQARAESAEALSAIEHERALLIQKTAEEAKVKTAKAIAAAKAQAERENEGLYLRRLKAKMEQTRQKNIAIIHALAGHFASSMTWAAKHPCQVFVFVGYLSLIFAAIFAAREAARLCRLLLEASIGKPRLVRETSCASLPRSVVSAILDLFRRQKTGDECIDEIFQDVVLSDPLKDRVVTLAKAARSAKRHDAPYRHVLLYGAPGTGKTMVAKKLAQSTGMDFALMSGGDVGPLQADAVTQLHSLFRWAKMSRKGLLLFVDEAEAFLGNRKHSKMSENTHNALNALLYHTGGERRDFLLVLATNRAEDLDEAVLDRCDESLLFGLPDAESRQRLIAQYYEAFVKDEVVKNNELATSLCSRIRSYMTQEDPFRLRINDDVMDEEQLWSIVAATEGFSGREIGKLMVAVQANLYSSDSGKLTKDMVQNIAEIKVDEHREKLRMAAGDVVSVPAFAEKHELEEEDDGTLRLINGDGDTDDDDEEEEMSVKELVETLEVKTPDPQQARQAGRRALARAAASSSSSRPGIYCRTLFSQGSTSTS